MSLYVFAPFKCLLLCIQLVIAVLFIFTCSQYTNVCSSGSSRGCGEIKNRNIFTLGDYLLLNLKL